MGYSSGQTPISSAKNHGSELSRPDVIDAYLARECELGATCGPFSSNPLSNALTTSPLQIAYSRTGKPRVVVDLSFPREYSVNSGIPTATYLGDDFKLRLYPGSTLCWTSFASQDATVTCLKWILAELIDNYVLSRETIIFLVSAIATLCILTSHLLSVFARLP